MRILQSRLLNISYSSELFLVSGLIRRSARLFKVYASNADLECESYAFLVHPAYYSMLPNQKRNVGNIKTNGKELKTDVRSHFYMQLVFPYFPVYNVFRKPERKNAANIGNFHKNSGKSCDFPLKPGKYYDSREQTL
jgi:hypothetical protein